MSVIIENENPEIVYTIPEEIKSKIPAYFYQAMAGELVSVFGACALNTSVFENMMLEDLISTSGWVQALNATCRKLDMLWLWDYWKTLEWYDSDLFDSEVSDEITNFLERDVFEATEYYKYISNGLNHPMMLY